MFSNSQMMGMSIGFPDVCKTPTPMPNLVPTPYPNVTIGPGTLAPDYVKCVKIVRDQKTAQDKASKDLSKALDGLLSAKTKAAKAMDGVNVILVGIAKLQAQQKRIVKDAAQLEADVTKAFKTFDKLAKSPDKKAYEAAKVLLIGKGLALSNLISTLGGLNKTLEREHRALEKAIKALK